VKSGFDFCFSTKPKLRTVNARPEQSLNQYQEHDNQPAIGLTTQHLFERVWAIFGLLLLAGTWRLWTPQTAFPQVPLFTIFIDASPWVDWLTSGVLVIGLVAVLVRPSVLVARFAFLLIAAALVGLFCIDQHRLQPWAWHWMIFAVLMWRLRTSQALVWMRWIVVSIYLYSAVSKLDYQFANTVGLQMLETIVGGFGASLAGIEWLNANASRVVLLLPLCELLVGFALAFRRTRFIGGVAAMGLHMALIAVLGPLGMNHRSPVLVWNAFFVFQAYWLFVRPSSKQQTMAADPPAKSDWFATSFSLAVILFPITCNVGICDHWLAWELYARRSSRAKIELVAGSDEHLPEHVRPFVRNTADSAWTSEVDLAAWSLDTLNVPVYPQARFQVGVADSLNRQLKERSGGRGIARLTICSRANRWSGAREQQPVSIEKAQRAYWLNSMAD
jgi:hypothetical protein